MKFNATGAAHFTGDDAVAAGSALSPVQIFTASDLTFQVGGFGFRGALDVAKSGADITLTLTNVTLKLGDAPEPVVVTLTAGTFTLSSQGVYGGATGTVVLNLDGTPLASVNATVLVNRTSATQTILVGVGRGQLAARPRTLTNVSLLGQSLSGTLELEQVAGQVSPQAPPGTPAPKVVRIKVTNLSLFLGDQAANAGVQVTNGNGYLVRTAAGLAGRISLTLTVKTGAASTLNFTGNFSLAVNTTTTAVNEQVDTGNGLVSLVLPAGPYLRFEGTGVQVSFQGQRFSTDIVLESARVGTTDVVRVAFRNATAAFGDGTTTLVALTGGHGLFVLRNEGLAGTLSGHVALNLPSVELSGTFGLTINTASGSGTGFTSTITFGLTPTATTTLLLGDVNGDARPDLLVGTQGQGVIAYLNDGDGDPFDSVSGFTIGGTSTPSGSSSKAVTALALADLDHDGNVDLVVGRTGANEAYANDGHGVFTLTSATLGSGATALAVGDVDGDGLVDVVVGRSGGDAGAVPQRRLARVHARDRAVRRPRHRHDVRAPLHRREPRRAARPRRRARRLRAARVPEQFGWRRGLALPRRRRPDRVRRHGARRRRLRRRRRHRPGRGRRLLGGALQEHRRRRRHRDVRPRADGGLGVERGHGARRRGRRLGRRSRRRRRQGERRARRPPQQRRLADVARLRRLDAARYDRDDEGAGARRPQPRRQGRSRRRQRHADEHVPARHPNGLGAARTIGAITLDIAMGPYLNVSAEGASLTILGQTLTGDFAFTQQTLADGSRIVELDLDAVLSLADGEITVPIDGTLRITNGGISVVLALGATLDVGRSASRERSGSC